MWEHDAGIEEAAVRWRASVRHRSRFASRRTRAGAKRVACGFGSIRTSASGELPGHVPAETFAKQPKAGGPSNRPRGIQRHGHLPRRPVPGHSPAAGRRYRPTRSCPLRPSDSWGPPSMLCRVDRRCALGSSERRDIRRGVRRGAPRDRFSRTTEWRGLRAVHDQVRASSATPTHAAELLNRNYSAAVGSRRRRLWRPR